MKYFGEEDNHPREMIDKPCLRRMEEGCDNEEENTSNWDSVEYRASHCSPHSAYYLLVM
jgi:hypothetical protein